jgi:hypothetical protein
MIFEEELESYRLLIRSIYNKLLKKGALTDSKRNKLQGAEMILSTILRRQSSEYFIRLAKLDLKGRNDKIQINKNNS